MITGIIFSRFERFRAIITTFIIDLETLNDTMMIILLIIPFLIILQLK